MSELVDIAGRPLGSKQEAKRGNAYIPFEVHLKEATTTVEQELRLEDAGWVALGAQSSLVIPDADRITNLLTSRLYHAKDPLGHQAVRLWTDYTFGSGMTWSTESDQTRTVLEEYWQAPNNRSILSARGQRRSSDRLLVDGELFFVLFLGKEITIRLIDPLEITEIISDPEDIEDVKFYKREWVTSTGQPKRSFYRSWTNPGNEAAADGSRTRIEMTEDAKDALVYHMTYNTITQRGNPLLLPALDWLKQYRRFLASRVAIMLAMAKFAWHSKVQGGSTATSAIRSTLHEQEIDAGSTLIENMGVDTTPITQATGAQGAYQDGRMLKLQVAAAVGIPEQYFGDISIGNLATAKTVELPMQKMFTSYQAVWRDTFHDLDEIVLTFNKVPNLVNTEKGNKWYVDRDFPPIAPADVMGAAKAMLDIITVFPDFATLSDVQQTALMILQINDTAKVLEQLDTEEGGNLEARALKGLRHLSTVLKENNGGSK